MNTSTPAAPAHACPYCTYDTIRSTDVVWSARSTDPSDPDNVADLVEWQCGSCAMSFWLPTAENPT